MKPYRNPAHNAVDRPATYEEIRAADARGTDLIEDCLADLLCEIASDYGGYVRISPSEMETVMALTEFCEKHMAEAGELPN